MKREVIANGSPAQLLVRGDQFLYERVGSASISGSYAVTGAGPGSCVVRLGARVYRVTLGQTGEVAVNGRSLRMEVFDPRDLRAGGESRAQQGRMQVAAPMPGKIVRVLVAVGDAVKPGQGLVVVEAMKMQNEMKSPRAGHVVEVRARDGAAVVSGEILVVVE